MCWSTGREPIAQPLPLLELFDPRQVLEEERRAGHLSVLVMHEAHGVPDDLSGGPQAKLRPVGEVMELEGARQDAHEIVAPVEHFGERPCDVVA